MKTDIETFGEVHEKGDSRRPWNTGIAGSGLRKADIDRQEARFRQRRRRDVGQALTLGVSLDFDRVCDDCLHKRGAFGRG